MKIDYQIVLVWSLCALLSLGTWGTLAWAAIESLTILLRSA